MNLNIYKKFKRLLNESKPLITESASPQEIEKAIEERRRVEITYNDEGNSDGSGRAEGIRHKVEIYVYGKNKFGNDAIRAFQLGIDDSYRHKNEPCWVTFRTDRIMSFNFLNSHFVNEPRARGYNVQSYNKDGDGSFSEIYCQVKFDKEGDMSDDLFFSSEADKQSTIRRKERELATKFNTDGNVEQGPVFSDSAKKVIDSTWADAVEKAKDKLRRQKKSLKRAEEDPYSILYGKRGDIVKKDGESDMDAWVRTRGERKEANRRAKLQKAAEDAANREQLQQQKDEEEVLRKIYGDDYESEYEDKLNNKARNKVFN